MKKKKAPETIIEALYDYFRSCPLLGDKKINIDYLSAGSIEYSIDGVPTAQIIKEYTDGSSVCQYLFVFRSVNDYGAEALQNLANSGFFEKFADWLKNQTIAGNLPHLPAGKIAQKIEDMSTGYLFQTSADTGKYQIQCRLTYLQCKKG